jgi:hypothetical protein
MEEHAMEAHSANPKIARGLNSLYAQMRRPAGRKRGALLARDFIDMGVPREDRRSAPGSSGQPISDADLMKKLVQFFGSNTALPSKLWPTETLRQALASFLQSLKDEAKASLGSAGREQSGAA